MSKMFISHLHTHICVFWSDAPTAERLEMFSFICHRYGKCWTTWLTTLLPVDRKWEIDQLTPTEFSDSECHTTFDFASDRCVIIHIIGCFSVKCKHTAVFIHLLKTTNAIFSWDNPCFFYTPRFLSDIQYIKKNNLPLHNPFMVGKCISFTFRSNTSFVC